MTTNIVRRANFNVYLLQGAKTNAINGYYTCIHVFISKSPLTSSGSLSVT